MKYRDCSFLINFMKNKYWSNCKHLHILRTKLFNDEFLKIMKHMLYIVKYINNISTRFTQF